MDPMLARLDERLGGGADVAGLAGLAAQLADLTSKVRFLTKTGDTRRARKPEDAVLLDGACPPSLRACDPDEEARRGRTCPDVRLYAPDPLIVDEEGHVCYAPADLEKWAGARNMSDLDTMIERGASELFRMMSSSDALMEKVKAVALQSAVIKLTKPRLLAEKDCATPGLGTDLGKCTAWNNTVIQAQELDSTVLNDGLTAAVAKYTAGANTGATKDMVFRAYDGASVATAYATAMNPATVAYAGATAWAKRADALAKSAGVGTDKPSRYDTLVKKLPDELQAVNEKAASRVSSADKDKLPAGLKNLTFDAAWPLIMTARIGLRALKNAATSASTATLASAMGVSATELPAAFAKLSAAQQWSNMAHALAD